MTANLRYEWRRISSVRATWILSGCALVLVAVWSEFLAWVLSQLADANAQQASESGLTVDQSGALRLGFGEFLQVGAGNTATVVLLSVVAAQAFGQEFRHGTIRLTLTLFPRRVAVFVAKHLVLSAVVVAVFIVSVCFAALIALPNGRAVDFALDGTSLLAVMRFALYLIGYMLIVSALTVLTRVLALGVIIPAAMAFLIERVIVLSGQGFADVLPGFLKNLHYVLPFTCGQGFVGDADLVRNGLVYLAWVVVLLAAALWNFLRRDA